MLIKKKEIKVSTAYNHCSVGKSSTFHFNFENLSNNHELFIGVKDVHCPPAQKKINFSMYYGAETSSLTAQQVKNYECNYSNFKELGLIIMANANGRSSNSQLQMCRNFHSSHSSHICDYDLNNDMLIVDYIDGKFFMQIGKGHMLTLSAELVKLMGFHDVILSSLNDSEKEGKTEKEILEGHKTPVKFSKAVYLGRHCTLFKPYETKIHFEFPNLIDLSYVHNRNGYSILFTFDQESRCCPEDGNFMDIRKMTNPYFREIKFSLYDNLMRPAAIDSSLLKTDPIFFTLVLFEKI